MQPKKKKIHGGSKSAETAGKALVTRKKSLLPMTEQRSAIRHRTDLKASVRALESQSWVQVELMNLSKTGARFQGVLITVPGAVVAIRIVLTEIRKTYEYYGVVIWRSKGAFGIQFI